MSTIVAVQTRGNELVWSWVTHFRLELSPDCVNFSPVLDDLGLNVVNINCSLLIRSVSLEYKTPYT